MHRSPFEFGGGEKRLISIAAALVRKPKILILDEPTAGLDAMSSHLVWEIIHRLRLRLRLSIILISHELESLVLLVDRLVVLHKGRIAYQGSPEEVFSKHEGLLHLGMELPQITILGYELEKYGIRLKSRPIFEVREAAELIEEWLKS
jgi:energy-coupling factor transport system ATP-binding protein